MNHIKPGHYLATGQFSLAWTQTDIAGHYARVIRTPTGATLNRAIDMNKDQTYYLSQVQEAQLAKVSRASF